jgi:drug/metabolite transporter (DMT)-like permease
MIDYFSSHPGELAALATAVAWTVSAMSFAAAAVRIGSLPLNVIRLAMALAFFVALEWIVRGLPLPTDATPHAWLWLSLSGLVGFTLGDLCLFRAFVVIGPRLTMLVVAVVPMVAAIVSWFALDEALSPLAIVGMALTVAGVVWVLMEREPSLPRTRPRATLGGVLLALGAAVCQAIGLVLSKAGVQNYDAFAATEVRVIAGLAGFVVLVVAVGAIPRLKAGLSHRGGLSYAALGAFFGPFLGVAMSMVAVKYAQVGVASAIISVVPVLIIPFVVIFRRERVSLRAVLGALLAVAGVTLLFWQGQP